MSWFLLLVLSALLHASWNVLVKGSEDPVGTALLVVGALCAMPGLIWWSAPPVAAWPWVFGGVVMHNTYVVLLVWAYRQAPVSEVYPISRGTGPVVVAALSALMGEPLGAGIWVGVLCIGLGVALIGWTGGARVRMRSALVALGLGCVIGVTHVVDSMGARSCDPRQYMSFVTVLDAVPIVVYALWRRQTWGAVFRPLPVAAGVLAVASYAIYIVAIAEVPVAWAAPIRESSIGWALLLAWWGRGERPRPSAVLDAAVVFSGLVMLRTWS